MVAQLGEDVWWYDLRGVNAFLVDDGGDLTLVDAGSPWDGRRILLGIDEAGFSVRDLERILVTHFDVDHVGALGRLPGVDATIHVGRDDAGFLTGAARPDLGNHKGWLQRALGPFLREPDLPVEPVADGEAVGSFTAYHTPGHTPGHTAYVSESLSAAFLGDLVIETGGRLQLPPRVFSYDTGRVRGSVRAFARRAPAFELAGVGHGTPFASGGRARIDDLVDSL